MLKKMTLIRSIPEVGFKPIWIMYISFSAYCVNSLNFHYPSTGWEKIVPLSAHQIDHDTK